MKTTTTIRTAGWLAAACLALAALMAPATVSATDNGGDQQNNCSEQDTSHDMVANTSDQQGGDDCDQHGDGCDHVGQTSDGQQGDDNCDDNDSCDHVSQSSGDQQSGDDCDDDNDSCDRVVSGHTDGDDGGDDDDSCPTPTPVPSVDVTPSPVPSVDVTPSPVPSVDVTPSPVPSVDVTPSASLDIQSEAPSATPAGSVLGETGVPEITPPATDSSLIAGIASGNGWTLVLAALAVILAGVLLVTPSKGRARR